jgi:hypothetical protein
VYIYNVSLNNKENGTIFSKNSNLTIKDVNFSKIEGNNFGALIYYE